MEGKAHVYTHLSNVIKHPGWGCSVNHKYRKRELIYSLNCLPFTVRSKSRSSQVIICYDITSPLYMSKVAKQGWLSIFTPKSIQVFQIQICVLTGHQRSLL